MDLDEIKKNSQIIRKLNLKKIIKLNNYKWLNFII